MMHANGPLQGIRVLAGSLDLAADERDALRPDGIV